MGGLASPAAVVTLSRRNTGVSLVH